jgi:hypothetical protein
MILDNSKFKQIEPAILGSLHDADHINIATAFFTNERFLKQVIDAEQCNCTVRLVVRLNDATNPHKLIGFIDNERIDMRYFRSSKKERKFHPKCYIIQSQGSSVVAYVGSANLTIDGMQKSKEIMVSIEDTDDLNSLDNLFKSYWKDSEVITKKILMLAIDAYEEHKASGDNGGKKGGYGDQLPFGEDEELQSYQREYQDYGTKFNQIKVMYENKGIRKFTSALPIRIEIDGFLSSVDNFLNQQEGNFPENTPDFDSDFTRWINQDDTYVETLEERYSIIFNGLSEIEIQNQNLNTFGELINRTHAPRTAVLRSAGGMENFIDSNESMNRVMNRLSYLLGYEINNESQIERMHNLINNNNYKLNHFGESSIQELVGWCSNEELPIINERSKRILDYYF